MAHAQMMVKVQIETTSERFRGFRYWWARIVEGFNPKVHCYYTFVGPRIEPFNVSMPVNQEIFIPCKQGDLIYFCGVSQPYKWDKNFHLAGVAADGETADKQLYTGDWVRTTGLREIDIDPTAAQSQYEHLGPRFTTCRNFQFAAQMAADGVIPVIDRSKPKPAPKPKGLFE